MSLTVVILTKNEEQHIERAIRSVKAIADRCVVVDSYSNDQTVAIAEANGAVVLQNRWVNHATQFNWALDQLPGDTEWVLRLDADEIVTLPLVNEINLKLSNLGKEVTGVCISRRMTFLGRPIHWGGLFPIRIIRIFRHNHGRCENRWMDEHIIVRGAIENFENEIIDDNLNSLTWWTEKHNGYASREVVDLLNLEHGFMMYETPENLRGGKQVGVKRWFKERMYTRLPGGLRAFIYFFYRFILRLGFLDGREGVAFHVLQGFWYRYLVDAKLYQVRLYMRKTGCDAPTAIHAVLGINILN